MIRALSRTLVAGLFAIALAGALILSGTARAEVAIRLTPNALAQTAPGGTAPLTATLLNIGADPFPLKDLRFATIVISGFPRAALSIALNYGETYRQNATVLTNGQSQSVTLGTVTVAGGAADGTYGFTIEAYLRGGMAEIGGSPALAIAVATPGGGGPIGDDNALTAYIATLSVGQMGTGFATPSLTGALIDSGGGKTILEWSEQAYWDPARNKILFNGQGHLATPKQLVYTAGSNAWSNGTTDGCNAPGGENHGYDHNAMDPATGRLFYRCYNSKNIRVQNPDTGAWSAYSSVPTADPQQVAGALEWFPDMNGIVFVDSRLGVWHRNDSTGTWTQIAGGTVDTAAFNISIGTHSNFAVYNPSCSCLFLGGGQGNPNMYRVTNLGAISQVAGLTAGLGIASAVVLPNSANNTLLAFHNDGNIYQYSIASNVWSDVGNHSVFSTADEWRIGGAIEEYGVFFFILENATPNFWVYKYTSVTDPFELACLNQNVIQCVDFDDAGDFGASSSGGPVFPASGSGEVMVRDTAVKASGGASARCRVNAGDGADVCGSYTVNFTPGTLTNGGSPSYPDQFGEGEEFWIQFKTRFSAGYVAHLVTGNGFDGTCFGPGTGACGPKFGIFGESDRPGFQATSCTNLELVLADMDQRGLLQGYHSCGNNFAFGQTPMGGSDFDLQPPNACSYQALNGDQSLYDDAPCIPLVEELWIEITLQVKIGTWGGADSTIRIYQRNEGQPVRQLVIERTNFAIVNDNPANARIGKAWLTPYHTVKDPAEAHPEFFIWYDDLVISRAAIP